MHASIGAGVGPRAARSLLLYAISAPEPGCDQKLLKIHLVFVLRVVAIVVIVEEAVIIVVLLVQMCHGCGHCRQLDTLHPSTLWRA
jgi:hypothetical protein